MSRHTVFMAFKARQPEGNVESHVLYQIDIDDDRGTSMFDLFSSSLKELSDDIGIAKEAIAITSFNILPNVIGENTREAC